MARQHGSRTRARRRLPRRVGLTALALVVLTALGALVMPVNASASSHCATPSQQSRTYTITHCTVVVGDQDRSYLLSLPPSLTQPAPLVVAFHGLFQTVDGFAAQTGLLPAARNAGLVLAIPESDGPAFNDSRLGAHGPADDAFTLALIQQLSAAGFADASRVTVVGYSNGAGMAMSVASRHPKAVAAVVSIDGSLIDAPGAPRPTGAVRAVLVHGTNDRIQPWQGRPAKGELLPAYLPVPETVSHWVGAAGGGPATVAHLVGPRDVDVSTWATGRAQVVSYTVAGMGHDWPVAAKDTIDATALVTRVASSVVVSAPAATSKATAPRTGKSGSRITFAKVPISHA